MATGLYNAGRQAFLTGGYGGNFNTAAGAGKICAMLLQTSVGGDATHYLSPSVGSGGTSTDSNIGQIPGFAANGTGCVTAGSFGTPAPITGIVYVPPGGGPVSNNGAVYAANLSFNNQAQQGALIVNAIIIWYFVAGSSATSTLIAFIDSTGTGSPGLPVTPNGSTITLQWPTVSPGIFTL